MYSFYTKKDDPFNFSYLNAAYNAGSTTPKTTNTSITLPASRVNVTSSPAPKTPPPTTQTQQSPYTDQLSKITQSQTDFYNNQAAKTAEGLKSSYDTSQKYLSEQIPQMQGFLSNYQNLADKSVNNQQQYTEQQKQELADQAGKEQFMQAQAAREGRGRLQNTFASLGAVDSSAFQNFAARAEDRLARGQDESRGQLKRDTGNLDREFSIFKDQTELAKMQEVEKFNAAVRQIQASMQQGTSEYQSAVQAAYDRAQENIFGIQRSLAEKEADYQYKAREAGLETAAGNLAAQQNTGKALNMVNNLIGGNYQAVSGGFRTPGFMTPLVPGSAAARADYEGLKNLLTLAARGQLKGSGAVSDFETKMLEKAAMAGLSPELPEQEFLARLKLLQQDLMAGGANQSSQIVIAPDGQQIQIVD
jgi:hypothetical protein